MRTPTQRKQAAFARAYHSEQRQEWMHKLPCRVCGALPTVAAHTAGGGTGRKGPYQSTIPLCHRHHMEMHTGQKSFATKHGLNLEALAAEVEGMWARYSGGERSLFDAMPTWVTEEGE